VNKLNIRGALEHVRGKMAEKKKISSAADLPVDKMLNIIYADTKFHSQLLQGLQANHLQEEDVKRCFGALYHEASKDLHGTSGELIIHQKDWAINERFSLAAIFTFYKIPFMIMSTEGLIDKVFDLSMFKKL
jgi:hypothetical protein